MPEPRRRLTFSDHVVRDRLARRGIKKRDIRQALNNVDTSYPGTRKKSGKNLIKEGLTNDGRRLCVVVKEQRPHIVVTAWWKDAD
jgi:hypothetical protein